MSQAATLSASFCTGACADSAFSTSAMMREKVVSLPTRSVVMSSAPESTSVPANTAAPTSLSLGMLSPVMEASFTDAWPLTTRPSTGIFSPGRTRTTSPTFNSLSGTVRSQSDPRTSATCGTEPINNLIEARARTVFNSAMNSAIRMITINTAPATVSPPNTATSVATVMKISVPTLWSWIKSSMPVFTRGYRPTATAAHRTWRGTRPCQ